jgi:hypothetical protein
VRIVDVAAEPVCPPRRGHELHRPLSSGGALVAELVEGALDEVDRGKNAPPHAKPVLRFSVVTEQRRRRQGGPGSETSAVGARCEAPEVPLGRQVRLHLTRDRGWNEAQRRARETRPAGKQELDPLIVERVERDLPRRPRVAGGNPRVDGAPELGLRLYKRLGKRRGLPRNRCSRSGRGTYEARQGASRNASESAADDSSAHRFDPSEPLRRPPTPRFSR